ncbi:hypothetical protein ADIAL_0610 [Alkalibacterium sp. AK22]|uniref:DUF58 domain-containing protein n=1 Tax=Alkalibacterium sp. AK22 TaxID=1229520 RepID=UPI0004512095|nr:DUF58 domain-containing protein [Alkalibacterium sp. AK22]EXJ23818.1 hypothetical protein ADIAL_0610 [Alkalibacterium sp. AK22]
MTKLRLILYFFLYVLILLYTLAFATTVSWFILYSFTLMLLLAFLSSRQRLVIYGVNWYKTESGKVGVSCKVRGRHRLPLVLSSMSLKLNTEGHSNTQYSTCFLSRLVPVYFQPVKLTRGLHEHLRLDIEAVSIFGLWKRRLTYALPVHIEIYPAVMTKTNRGKLMRNITPRLSVALHSPIHEFYVKEIRRYQQRDAMSLIDWKTSLRRGHWMVKDYEHEEEAPIDIYFYGTASDEFEFLLSIAYNLVMELNPSLTPNLYLLGMFGNRPGIRQSISDFLSIQPVDNPASLSDLYRHSLVTDRKRIIIKASRCTLPSQQTANQPDLILTEHDLHFLKGG